MRIAHFSDLHVLSLRGVGPERFLNKRITGYAMLRMNRSHVHKESLVRAVARGIAACRPDHVVLTGDLTNLALEAEFEAVRGLLDAELGLGPADLSIIPGNHDAYTGGAIRSKRFARYFGEYMTSDLPELAVELDAGRFPFVRLRGPAAIIGLSSAVPRAPLVAAGRLGGAQLAALRTILHHPEVASRTPVLLVHHPVHNPRSRLRARLRGLDDADALFASLRGVGRGLLLHGHLHRRIQQAWTTARGSMLSVGATSASLQDEDEARMAGFNVYEIDDAGEVASVEGRVLDLATGHFDVLSIPKWVQQPRGGRAAERGAGRTTDVTL